MDGVVADLPAFMQKDAPEHVRILGSNINGDPHSPNPIVNAFTLHALSSLIDTPIAMASATSAATRPGGSSFRAAV